MLCLSTQQSSKPAQSSRSTKFIDPYTLYTLSVVKMKNVTYFDYYNNRLLKQTLSPTKNIDMI